MHTVEKKTVKWSDSFQPAINCKLSKRILQFEQAVEILEEGRSIFWSQVLQLRTPLDDLYHASPKLAKRLRDISTAIERSAFRESSGVIRTDVKAAMTMDAEAVQFRWLNLERSAILAKVRALKGFEDFLRPKKFDSLRRAAVHGPVILLNATLSSCDALIVTATGVDHVPLSPQLTGQQLSLIVLSLSSAMISFPLLPNDQKASLETLLEHAQLSRENVHDRKAGRRHKIPPQSVDDILRGVLAVLWKLVVHPIILHLKLEVRSLLRQPCALYLSSHAEI